MSIAFTKTKSQTLELTTFLDFGKYKDCRVDSIIEQDHEYIQYLKFNKIRPLAPSVLAALENKFSASCIEVDDGYDEDGGEVGWNNVPKLFDDIPF